MKLLLITFLSLLFSGASFFFSSSISGQTKNQYIRVGSFSDQNLSGWETKQFKSHTIYSFEAVGDRFALKAVSKNGASGFIKKIRIDLDQFPYLNWQWRVDKPLSGQYNETEKSGDDYAARLYVVISPGFKFWENRAINYVWANHQRVKSVWPNAFAGNNARMIALQSANTPLSTWQTEKRNIKQDFQLIFGESIRFIDAVAIMSDTDNTGSSTEAFYGDIYFSTD